MMSVGAGVCQVLPYVHLISFIKSWLAPHITYHAPTCYSQLKRFLG